MRPKLTVVDAALLAIQTKVNGNWFRLTEHALTGMESSGITTGDVIDVIMAATDCTLQENRRYCIEGEVAKRPVRVVVERNYEPELVIITAHWIAENES